MNSKIQKVFKKLYFVENIVFLGLLVQYGLQRRLNIISWKSAYWRFCLWILAARKYEEAFRQIINHSLVIDDMINAFKLILVAFRKGDVLIFTIWLIIMLQIYASMAKPKSTLRLRKQLFDFSTSSENDFKISKFPGCCWFHIYFYGLPKSGIIMLTVCHSCLQPHSSSIFKHGLIRYFLLDSQKLVLLDWFPTCEKLESIFGRLVSADERSEDGGDTEDETRKQETKLL